MTTALSGGLLIWCGWKASQTQVQYSAYVRAQVSRRLWPGLVCVSVIKGPGACEYCRTRGLVQVWFCAVTAPGSDTWSSRLRRCSSSTNGLSLYSRLNHSLYCTHSDKHKASPLTATQPLAHSRSTSSMPAGQKAFTYSTRAL